MARLRTKTGCLTCLARKKKCDEARPRCGNCARLGLDCVTRQHTAISNQSAQPDDDQNQQVQLLHRPPIDKAVMIQSPSPQAPISSGYPRFHNHFELELVRRSPQIMQPFISRLASNDFITVPLFGRFATQSPLVRDAIVAFSAFRQSEQYQHSYKLCLSSYQNCITGLKTALSKSEATGPFNDDCMMTAIFFLGLLEGLGLGNPRNSIHHFEVCRKLLKSRLAQPKALEDPALVKVYRIVAECIIFNLATLQPLTFGVDQRAMDWGGSLDPLFPEGDHLSSPFFGGFREIYQVMLDINVLLSQCRPQDPGLPRGQVDTQLVSSTRQQLDRLEMRLPKLYVGDVDPAGVRLYRAKYRLHIQALRIHLTKISRQDAKSSDQDVRVELSQAIAVLKKQDILEPNNPSMRWPLTILACAADGEDSRFLEDIMRRMELIIDHANANKLSAARTILSRASRNSSAAKYLPAGDSEPIFRIDFLLDPWRLDDE